MERPAQGDRVSIGVGLYVLLIWMDRISGEKK